MTFRGFRTAGTIVVLCGALVALPIRLTGEERAHPSLVDPAITHCSVCHSSFPSSHPSDAARDCLSCHTFLERSGKTVLMFEGEERAPAAVADQAVRSQTGNEAEVDVERGSPRTDFPGVRTEPPTTDDSGASIPADRPTLAPTPPTTRVAPSTTFVGDSAGADRWDDRYTEGMRAFNRGELDQAFNTWSLMVNAHPDWYVLQVEVDTYLVSAQSTIARYGDHSLYALKKDNMYWVLSGLFATRGAAEDALKALPEPLRRGGAFPITVRDLTR
ncbi:MAG: SPOR domain-containing protein [Acidobacteriota bacterium]